MIATESNGRRRVVALSLILGVVVALLLVVEHRAGRWSEAPLGRDAARTGAATLGGGARHATLAPALPSLEAGALRLEGMVTDAEEQPVGGAIVSIGGGRSVVTELDGSFAFEELAEGLYDVVAERLDAYGESREVRLDASSEPVVLALTRGPTVVVHVQDARGVAVAGAKVETSSRTAITRADGRATLRGVDLDAEYVNVSAATYADARERVKTGDDPAATFERTIVLRRGALIAGTVVDPDGRPVADARIALDVRGGDGVARTYADADGRWELAAVAAGSFTLTASSDELVEGPAVEVAHDGEHPVRDLVVRAVPGAEVAGVVVDTSGAPVAEARVSIGPRTVDSDAAGRFVAKGLPPDTYDVTASTATQGARSQRLVVATRAHLSIRIVLEASRIAGIVVDAAGLPLEDATVFARSDDPNGYGHARSDARGRFDLGGLPPGEWTLTAQREDSSVETAPVRVHSGEHRVRLVVQERSGLVGRVLLDGAPVPYFGFYVTDDPTSRYETPAPVRATDGRFAARDAKPGTWSVVIVGPGFAALTVPGVVIRPGEVTDVGDLVVGRGGRVHGRVVDRNGAGVPGATVRIRGDYDREDTSSLELIVRGGLTATTDARGAYAIDGVTPSTQDRRIEATHPTQGTSAYRPFTETETEIELVMLDTGTIDGTLVNTGDREHVVARLVGQIDASYFARSEGGRFQLDLPPGRYELYVARNVRNQIVDVRPRARVAVTFTFPTQAVTLRVRVTETCDRAVLYWPGAPDVDSAEAAAFESCKSQQLVFEDLAPGAYALCLDGDRCRPILVTTQLEQALTIDD